MSLMLVFCTLWADRHIQCFQETPTCLILGLKKLKRPQTPLAPWTPAHFFSQQQSCATCRFSHHHMVMVSSQKKQLHMYRAGSSASQIAAGSQGGLTLYYVLNLFSPASSAWQARGHRTERTPYQSSRQTRTPSLRRPPPPLQRDGGPKPFRGCATR